jgi:molybdenum cofactor biosynthesis enzyme MoaA
MKIKRITNNYPPNMLRIEYMLGNLCNYKCNYCFPGSNEGTVRWPDIELVKNNLTHLLNFYKKNGKDLFQFYLIGGEPTLWKDLPILTKYLKEEFGAIINISTNGSRKSNWWIDNADKFDDIEISVHHEFVDTDHVIEVADIIYEKGVNTVANVLMDPNNFEKCISIIEKLKLSNCPWPIIAKSVHYNGETKYTEEQKKYFADTVKRMPDMDWYNTVNRDPVWKKITWVDTDTEKIQIPSNNWFTINKINHFTGWTCNLGVDHIEIFQDGTISGNCKQKIWGLNYHYNLYDLEFINNFNPTLVPVICKQLICQCTSEIIINKYA